MKKEIVDEIQRSLSRRDQTTVTIETVRAQAGGSINQAAVIETNAGTFFAKTNARPLADQFECEAAGLEALARADTTLAVPAPLAWQDSRNGTDGFLVMEYFEPGPRVPDFDEKLGRGLASLHRNTSSSFGFDNDNYCGATPQPNPWTAHWVEFYREHRLEHQLTLGSYDSSARRKLKMLFDRVDGLLDIDAEPPALIHGDLWSGNLHANEEGRPALIDPAVYYGHREAELGMMKLFGGFSQRVWDAYEEAYPLQPGWRDRLPLYELYHVMNHNTLFGGGYGRQAVSIAERYI